MAEIAHGGRQVRGLVDGNGIYSSRLATGAGFVFVTGPAVADDGTLAAPVPDPYQLSPTAHARAQIRAMLGTATELLASVGGSLEDLLQLEQYVERKAHAHGYLTALRSPGGIETRRPASGLATSGPMTPEGVIANALMIGTAGHAKEIVVPFTRDLQSLLPDPTFDEPPYNEVLGAGDYLFTLGDIAFELGVGVHPDAVAPDWTWFGNETASEADFALKTLATRLEAAGSDLSHVVHMTVTITDIDELADLDDAWQRWFPQDPPARTVIPVTGLSSPRREDAHGHAENAHRFMGLSRSVRRGTERVLVSGGDAAIGAATPAIRAGGLVWISGQTAAPGADPAVQVAQAFEQVAALCAAAGTDVGHLLVLRAFVTDPRATEAVYARVRETFGPEPPCVLVLPVRGPLPIPGTCAILDGIAC